MHHLHVPLGRNVLLFKIEVYLSLDDPAGWILALLFTFSSPRPPLHRSSFLPPFCTSAKARVAPRFLAFAFLRVTTQLGCVVVRCTPRLNLNRT